MKLLVVEVNRDETNIYKVLVDEGKFRQVKTITGHFMEQAMQLLMITLKERPLKVIVDDVGVGKGVLDALIKTMDEYGLVLKDDGTVKYI